MATLYSETEQFSIGIGFYVFSQANETGIMGRVLSAVSARVHCGILFFVNGELLPWDLGAWVGRSTGASPLGLCNTVHSKMRVQLNDVCAWKVSEEVFHTVYSMLCTAKAGHLQNSDRGTDTLPRLNLAYPPVSSIIAAHILHRMHLSGLVRSQEPRIQCAQYCLSVFRYLLFACPNVFDQTLDVPFARLQDWRHGLSPQLLYDSLIQHAVSHRVLGKEHDITRWGAPAHERRVKLGEICIIAPHHTTLMMPSATYASQQERESIVSCCTHIL